MASLVHNQPFRTIDNTDGEHPLRHVSWQHMQRHRQQRHAITAPSQHHLQHVQHHYQQRHAITAPSRHHLQHVQHHQQHPSHHHGFNRKRGRGTKRKRQRQSDEVDRREWKNVWHGGYIFKQRCVENNQTRYKLKTRKKPQFLSSYEEMCKEFDTLSPQKRGTILGYVLQNQVDHEVNSDEKKEVNDFLSHVTYTILQEAKQWQKTIENHSERTATAIKWLSAMKKELKDRTITEELIRDRVDKMQAAMHQMRNEMNAGFEQVTHGQTAMTETITTAIRQSTGEILQKVDTQSQQIQSMQQEIAMLKQQQQQFEAKRETAHEESMKNIKENNKAIERVDKGIKSLHQYYEAMSQQHMHYLRDNMQILKKCIEKENKESMKKCMDMRVVSDEVGNVINAVAKCNGVKYQERCFTLAKYQRAKAAGQVEADPLYDTVLEHMQTFNNRLSKRRSKHRVLVRTAPNTKRCNRYCLTDHFAEEFLCQFGQSSCMLSTTANALNLINGGGHHAEFRKDIFEDMFIKLACDNYRSISLVDGILLKRKNTEKTIEICHRPFYEYPMKEAMKKSDQSTKGMCNLYDVYNTLMNHKSDGGVAIIINAAKFDAFTHCWIALWGPIGRDIMFENDMIAMKPAARSKWAPFTRDVYDRELGGYGDQLFLMLLSSDIRENGSQNQHKKNFLLFFGGDLIQAEAKTDDLPEIFGSRSDVHFISTICELEMNKPGMINERNKQQWVDMAANQPAMQNDKFLYNTGDEVWHMDSGDGEHLYAYKCYIRKRCKRKIGENTMNFYNICYLGDTHNEYDGDVPQCVLAKHMDPQEGVVGDGKGYGDLHSTTSTNNNTRKRRLKLTLTSNADEPKTKRLRSILKTSKPNAKRIRFAPCVTIQEFEQDQNVDSLKKAKRT